MGNIADIYGGGFDTSSVEAASGFEPLAAGWYPVEIENAEIRDTKAGTGKYLKLELSVIGEQHNGRKLWPNINLMNPNAKAVEIGMRELAALGLACGLAAITDTDELLGKQIQARVKIKQEKGYDPDNEVTAYKPLGSGQTAAAPSRLAAQPAQPQPAAQPGSNRAGAAMRPWER